MKDLETLVSKTLENMKWMMEYGIDKLNLMTNDPDVELGEPDGWDSGGDDSTYDYIPSGSESIVWIAKAFDLLIYPEVTAGDITRKKKGDVAKRQLGELPYQNDCSPQGEWRNTFKRLALCLGYSKLDLLNSGYRSSELWDEELLDWDYIIPTIDGEDIIDHPVLGCKVKMYYLGNFKQEVADEEVWMRLKNEVYEHGFNVCKGQVNHEDIFLYKAFL